MRPRRPEDENLPPALMTPPHPTRWNVTLIMPRKRFRREDRQSWTAPQPRLSPSRAIPAIAGYCHPLGR